VAPCPPTTALPVRTSGPEPAAAVRSDWHISGNVAVVCVMSRDRGAHINGGKLILLRGARHPVAGSRWWPLAVQCCGATCWAGATQQRQLPSCRFHKNGASLSSGISETTNAYWLRLLSYQFLDPIKCGKLSYVADLQTIFLARFEVFTAVTMKNTVFWDVMPCGSCKNRRFGGLHRLHHQNDKNRWTRNKSHTA
jgi:hypothetical protein